MLQIDCRQVPVICIDKINCFFISLRKARTWFFFFFQTFLHYWFTQITQNYLNIYLLNDSQKKISYTLSIKFDVLIKLSIQSTHSQIILNIYICIGTKLLMVRGVATSVTYSTYKLHVYLQTYSYIVWTFFHELGYPIESASLRPT